MAIDERDTPESGDRRRSSGATMRCSWTWAIPSSTLSPRSGDPQARVAGDRRGAIAGRDRAAAMRSTPTRRVTRHDTFPATQEYDRESQRSFERTYLPTWACRRSRPLEAFARPSARGSTAPVSCALPRGPGRAGDPPRAGYRLAIVSNWSWNLRQRAAQVGPGPFL